MTNLDGVPSAPGNDRRTLAPESDASPRSSPPSSAPPGGSDDGVRGLSLRRKLLTTYGALALLSLLVVGMSWWAIAQWRATNDDLEGHYGRSLLLQRIRATAFRAFKEVPDAVTGGDQDARQEFEALLAPVATDFEQWASLANTDEEREQVRRVREAFDTLVRNSRSVFDLVDQGRRDEAFDLMENQLEDNNFNPFEALTDAAVESDRANRQVIRDQIQATKQTAQTVLALAAFGIVALVLLLLAYLASDLFGPLQEVGRALAAVARGDLSQRLDEERADEIGQVNRAFNDLVETVGRRQRMAALTSLPIGGDGEHGVTFSDGDGDDGAGRRRSNDEWRDTPSRVTLHRLVGALRTRVASLSADGAPEGRPADEWQSELIAELNRLSQAVARVTEFGLPLDLNLARTDVRALLYDVPLRFTGELAERGISLEVAIAPDVREAVVDRLKLREALAELVRNGLAALPERGGQLGLRASTANDGTILRLEVADDGGGAEPATIGAAFEPFAAARGHRPGIGLTLTKAVVEQHGGRIDVDSVPGEGTRVQIDLPLRA